MCFDLQTENLKWFSHNNRKTVAYFTSPDIVRVNQDPQRATVDQTKPAQVANQRHFNISFSVSPLNIFTSKRKQTKRDPVTLITRYVDVMEQKVKQSLSMTNMLESIKLIKKQFLSGVPVNKIEFYVSGLIIRYRNDHDFINISIVLGYFQESRLVFAGENS